MQILWELLATRQRLKKPARHVTTSDGSWTSFTVHVLRGLQLGMGGCLLVTRTIFLSCKIDWYCMVIYILNTILLFLIFPHIFQTQQKNFCSYWRIFMGSRYHQKYKQYKVEQSRINRNGLNVLCYLVQVIWKWYSDNAVGPVVFDGMGYSTSKWFRQFRNCLAALVKTVQRTRDWFSLNANSLAPVC